MNQIIPTCNSEVLKYQTAEADSVLEKNVAKDVTVCFAANITTTSKAMLLIT